MLATQPTEHHLAWYSAKLHPDIATKGKPTWTAHPTYPTIAVLVGPMTEDTDLGIGFVENVGDVTHIGSTLVKYVTSSDLTPEDSGDQEYRIKPWDKLVDADNGNTYYVVFAAPSTTRVKTVIGLRREDTRETELE